MPACARGLSIGRLSGEAVALPEDCRTPVPLGEVRLLKQVHRNRIIHLDDWVPGIEADAVWTDRPRQVAAVRTADCLPILLADIDGGCVAAVHAGWRGLALGVIATAIAGLPVRAGRLRAWIGPRICDRHYPVGREVVDAFPDASQAFTPVPGDDRWMADLVAIATAQLKQSGVARVIDSGVCSFADARFCSARGGDRVERNHNLVWLC